MKGLLGRTDAGLARVAVVGAATAILLGIGSAAWAIQNATSAHTVAERSLRVVQASAAPSLPTQAPTPEAREATPAKRPAVRVPTRRATQPTPSNSPSPRAEHTRTSATGGLEIRASAAQPLPTIKVSGSDSPHPAGSSEDSQDSADD